MKKNILLIFLLIVGGWSFAQNTSCSFGLEVSSSEAEVGDIITIDIATRQFDDIAGMQYTHQWNPSELEFIDVVYNSETPQGLNDSSFGFLNQGTLTFAFTNSNGVGGTLSDNTVLYSLRFRYLQEGEALIKIGGTPTAIEIIRLEGIDGVTIDSYYFITGGVIESNDNLPSLNSVCLTNASCVNEGEGQINIDVTGTALSYDWQGPNGFQASSETITDLITGHYTLEVQNGEQSIYTDFYLGNSADLELNLVTDSDECGGTEDGAVTSEVINGSGNYTYSWDNGATTANLNNIVSGHYSLTVTDINTGCSASASTFVSTITTVWVTTDELVSASCLTSSDGSIDISVDAPAGYGPFTYEWSNGATTEDIDQLESGFYLVTITASNGCVSDYASFVAIDNELDIDATITNADCQNAGEGSIALDIEEDDFSILWSNGATTATINDLAVGVYAVSLTELASTCSYEYEYTVVSTVEIQTAYSYTCNDDNAEIQLLIWDHSDAPYTVDWSTGEQTTTSPLDIAEISSIVITENGTYSVIITGASGCTYSGHDFIVSCVGNAINLNLSPAQSTVDVGATVCLDVEVDELSGLEAFQFTIGWDESLLNFTEVTNINIPGFNDNSYGTHLVDDGLLTVAWFSTTGVSVNIPSSLFTVCFEAISVQEVTTTVGFENFPVPVEFINENIEVEVVNTQNAQVTLNGGVIASEDELNLAIGQVETSQGGIVCVPVTSSSFSGLAGLQFSMAWDTEVLIFNNVHNVNSSNAGFSSIAESQEDGILRFVWTALGAEGIYLAENTTLFEVCFTAQGEEGVYPVTFSQDPIPAIAGNADGEQIDLVLQDGSVTIGNQVASGEATLSIATVAVDAGGSICVPIYADNITDLVAMQFSIVWDEELISFDRVEILDNVLNISENDFNTPEDGAFVFAWYSSSLVPVNLATGTPVFELCFTAGQQQAVAGINFSSQPTAIEFVNSNNEAIIFIPGNGQITITTDELVWPGDTDTDAAVNHFDLLNIGLAYGAQGAARNNASMNWLGQYAQPWEQNTPLSNVDYRFVDADGNGEINVDDVQVIIQNWDETTEEYTSSDGSSRELETATVPFYVEPATVEAGTSVSLPIILGTEDGIVEDAYGIAFSITYDPELVRPESAQIMFDGWLGAEADNVLGVYRSYHGYGRIDVAMVRTDGQNVTGQGEIASFAIIVEDVILRDEVDLELLISIENVRLINAEEEEMLTSPRETIVLVQNVTATNEAFELQGLQVSPNPTTASFKVEHANVAIQNIAIFDSRGQLQQKLEINSDTYNVEQLPAGVYWLKFQTDKGMTVRKLIKL